MATLNSTFTLDLNEGTDPVNISIAPGFSIMDPSGSGSFETSPSVLETLIPPAGQHDIYILIRNVGLASGTKAGRVSVKDNQMNDIAMLRLNDFLFMPVKAGVGIQTLYDTSVTTVQWSYWTRLGG